MKSGVAVCYLRCVGCGEHMVGVQAICACSFLCDCRGGGPYHTPKRSSVVGSAVVSGQRWCSECLPVISDDEPTLVEGLPMGDFEAVEATSPGVDVGSLLNREASNHFLKKLLLDT